MYEPGDVVRVRIKFAYACDTTVNGVLHLKGSLGDPVTVAVAVKAPGGAWVTYTYGASGSPVVRVKAGEYYLLQKFTAAGKWRFVWTGSGAGELEATKSGELVVDSSTC